MSLRVKLPIKLALNKALNKVVLQTIAINLDGGAKTRYDTYLGKQYLVVPCVMLTEGVHAGSLGPILYRNEDLSNTPEAWNKKPIVVYHPEINGQGVSACSPEILDNCEIGLIFNATFDDGRLCAEAWLDEDRVKEVDERILTAIEANQMVELSTGLFMELDQTPGIWNGEDYVAIARNHKPDHLAILPDKKGACSIADGAGLLRNQLSFDDTRHLLWKTLASSLTADRDFFVDTAFEKFFVYWLDGDLFMQNYTHTDAAVTFVGEPIPVERSVVFRTTGTGEIVGNQEESEMDKKKFVDGLISNSSWVEGDRSFLLSCSEEQLRNMGPLLNDDGTMKKVEEKPKAKETPKPEVAPAGNTAPTPTPVPVVNTQQTLDQFIQSAPVEIRDSLRTAQRVHAQRKTGIVKRIMENERNSFTEEQLNGMEFAQLEQLSALAGPTKAESEAPVGNYSGLGEILRPPFNNGGSEEPMDLPTMAFGDQAAS